MDYVKNMEKKWIILVRNIIILFIIIFVALYFYFSKKNALKEIVETTLEQRDLLSLQNTMDSGIYMGKMYEQTFLATSFPKDFISSLAVQYYIGYDGHFYEEDNLVSNDTFEKIVSKQDFERVVNKMFGPDIKVEIEEVEYGCNTSLREEGNHYIITSTIPDACGVFGPDEEFYISHLSNYYKKNNDIIIEFKVGYVEKRTEFDDEFEDMTYTLYQDKNKKNVVQTNYNQCVYTNDDKKCYDNFQNYVVTLKKASDGQYYFYQINRK